MVVEKVEGLLQELFVIHVNSLSGWCIGKKFQNRDYKTLWGFIFVDHPSESEEQLYAELLTTRLTLKDYEDKIKVYEMEKLRFIDTISYMVKEETLPRISKVVLCFTDARQG